MFTASVTRSTRINVGNIAKQLAGGPKTVKVGFPAGAVGSDIVQRAIWNHYGTRGGRSGGGWGGPIPARPFLSIAMRSNRKKYQNLMSSAAHSIFTGSGTPKEMLSKLGILAQGDIQAEITSLDSPPNSPVTIKLKGSSNPLIASGEMRSRVTWKYGDS